MFKKTSNLFNITTHFRGSLLLPELSKWITPESNILDFGCGDGIMANYLIDNLNIKITGTDVIKYLKTDTKISFIGTEEFETIQLENKIKYDGVLINDVLHHISLDKQKEVISKCLNLSRSLFILEDLPGIRTKFFDYLINKIREPNMKIPLSFRTLQEWEKLLINLPINFEIKKIFTPIWYPFKHAVIKINKSKPLNDLVSVIVSTYNEEKNIEKCIKSLKNQTHKNIEIIIVDSLKTTDSTQKLSKSLGATVFSYGNERSMQRNYGVSKAKGKYVLIIDADMMLENTVVASCLRVICSDSQIKGIIIPEISIGDGYWAKCKSLEKNCYIGDDSIEAARFFTKKSFDNVDGYNVKMVSGEDWDLSKRISRLGRISRIYSHIYHYEGSLSLLTDLKKKLYYSKMSEEYISKNISSFRDVFNFIFRPAYLRNVNKLVSDPVHAVGLLFMKNLEFLVGGFGAILFKRSFWKAILKF